MIQYFPTVTRDTEWVNQGRITNLIKDQSVFQNLELPVWTHQSDAVMLCGSTEFNKEMMEYLDQGGWTVGTLGEPATYVYEKAFVG